MFESNAETFPTAFNTDSLVVVLRVGSCNGNEAQRDKCKNLFNFLTVILNVCKCKYIKNPKQWTI
jgi:hypothetical protein